jgi:phosphohistidine phosphatase
MPRLSIVRHATAAFPRDVSDHERPLSSFGHSQAPRVGQALLEYGWLPESILVSSALRTRQTAAWIGEALGEDGPTPRLMDELYNASAQSILRVINHAPPGVESLLIVAHMPGVQDAALDLASAQSDESAVTDMALGYPPAGLCLFETDRPWAELDGRDAALKHFLTFGER